MQDNKEMPVFIYSELDDERFEVRKVEIFHDGRMGWASLLAEFGGTALSPEPISANIEMASNPVFVLTIIDREAFEELWKECSSE